MSRTVRRFAVALLLSASLFAAHSTASSPADNPVQASNDRTWCC
jgi:hypothetical protein